MILKQNKRLHPVLGTRYGFQGSLSDTQCGININALMICCRPLMSSCLLWLKVSCVAFIRCVKNSSCRDHWIFSSDLGKCQKDRTEEPGGGVNPSPPPSLCPSHSSLLQDALTDTRVFNLGDCAELCP